jgi:hypothetical protein
MYMCLSTIPPFREMSFWRARMRFPSGSVKQWHVIIGDSSIELVAAGAYR